MGGKYKRERGKGDLEMYLVQGVSEEKRNSFTQ